MEKDPKESKAPEVSTEVNNLIGWAEAEDSDESNEEENGADNNDIEPSDSKPEPSESVEGSEKEGHEKSGHYRGRRGGRRGRGKRYRRGGGHVKYEVKDVKPKGLRELVPAGPGEITNINPCISVGNL